jgi:hypothetical protein
MVVGDGPKIFLRKSTTSRTPRMKCSYFDTGIPSSNSDLIHAFETSDVFSFCLV